MLLENYGNLDYLNLYKLRQNFLVDKNKDEDELTKVKELHESSLKSLVDYHADHSDIFSTSIKRFKHIIGKRIIHEEETALELGCGRGTQISDILSIYRNVIAIDNSLAELIVTKKMIEQKGITDHVQLACACSESLPFVPESFNAVNMRSVLEHVKDQEGSLEEIYRVLKKGGILVLETPNRFTFHKEAHVKVYGVGFVPRKWMRKYVDLMTNKQVTFEGKRSPSYFELRALLKRAFDTHWEHRVFLIDESRAGITFIGKIYRKYDLVKKLFENPLAKCFCQTHYVAAWKQ
jgi:ubiquinone/menaquinone biosynthesis C-methylase UbiE